MDGKTTVHIRDRCGNPIALELPVAKLRLDLSDEAFDEHLYVTMKRDPLFWSMCAHSVAMQQFGYATKIKRRDPLYNKILHFSRNAVKRQRAR